MENKAKLLFAQEVRTMDIPAIAAKFKDDMAGLKECEQMIQLELVRVQKVPNRMGKPCEYEPLASAGWRKVKLFSSKNKQATKGESPDLRIIYNYDEEQDTVMVYSIGFRIKKRPRPAHDPYSRAEKRFNKLIKSED
jgi:mRNA-degrading endonuclease RelE of RelBE toxin-antitoxin system